MTIKVVVKDCRGTEKNPQVEDDPTQEPGTAAEF
jgi:hypothetical protein